MITLNSLEMASVILWSILAGFFYLFGSLFVRQSIKYREEPRVKILALVGLFLILDGVSRMFHPVMWLLFDPSLQALFFYISQIAFIAALIAIAFYVEREIFPASRYAITIALVIGEILYIINNYFVTYKELFSDIIAYIMGGACLLIILLYIRLAIKSTGKPRRDAMYIVIGIFFFAGTYVASVLEDIGYTVAFIGVITAIFAFISLPFLLKGFHLSL